MIEDVLNPHTAQPNGYPMTTAFKIHESKSNAPENGGWILYGNENKDGQFVVFGWKPRALLEPHRVDKDSSHYITGATSAKHFYPQQELGPSQHHCKKGTCGCKCVRSFF